MRRFPSIKKNTDFQKVYQSGSSYANGLLVMYVLESGLQNSRLGVSCSKKVGNSVVRHTMARKLREIFRLHLNRTKPGYDIVVVVRSKSTTASYKQIENSYIDLLNRHHINNIELK